MEFDKSRVFTTVNADEVLPGSIGYFADFYNELRRKVHEGDDIRELTYVHSAEYVSRFKTKKFSYGLFYLVEEPRDVPEDKFDKTKVLHPVNAEDAKVGSKGYFADDLYRLKTLVTRNSADIRTLTKVEAPTDSYRFIDQDANPYILFYPVEED